MNKDVLDQVLNDIANAQVGETTAHSTYVSGVFEASDSVSSSVLDRVLDDIKSATARETTAHSSYVSGVFED